MPATSAIGGRGVITVAVRRDPCTLRLSLFPQVIRHQSLPETRCHSLRATR